MSKNQETMTPQEQKKQKVLTIVGIALCVILLPILIVNLTLIVKSYVNPDEVPAIGGVSPLIVLTDSMLPEISSGDLIIAEKIDAGQIKVGDVISFFDPAGNGSSVVTHRVLEIREKDGQPIFITKGESHFNLIALGNFGLFQGLGKALHRLDQLLGIAGADTRDWEVDRQDM